MKFKCMHFLFSCIVLTHLLFRRVLQQLARRSVRTHSSTRGASFCTLELPSGRRYTDTQQRLTGVPSHECFRGRCGVQRKCDTCFLLNQLCVGVKTSCCFTSKMERHLFLKKINLFWVPVCPRLRALSCYSHVLQVSCLAMFLILSSLDFLSWSVFLSPLRLTLTRPCFPAWRMVKKVMWFCRLYLYTTKIIILLNLHKDMWKLWLKY